MLIKEVGARAILDSRGEKTIQVFVKTEFLKTFQTSAPEGKSTGKYESKPYKINLKSDIKFINKFDVNNLNKLIQKRYVRTITQVFLVLQDIEKIVKNKIGANSLFALEASILKAFAYENGKELYEFLGEGRKDKLKIRPVGNAIGGGLHSRGINNKKPDFQEFLFIANGRTFKESVKINEFAYKIAGKLLKAIEKNDEGAWETERSDEQVLEIMNEVKGILNKKGFKIDIGVDIAASSFCNSKACFYQRSYKYLNEKEQVKYIKDLIKNDNIFYIEDPLEQTDFKGFSRLLKKDGDKNRFLIVGDDLTVTNPERLKKAIKNKSINAIIVKPNQIGSLIKVKEVIELAKKYDIKTIISHRSGETKDSTIADLGVGFGCDFIKTGIYGKVRKTKLKRLIGIERKLK